VGTEDEIRAELRREREVSPPYNADFFRSAFTLDSHKNGDSVVRRSPLTAQQTSDLRNSGHGVSIVFGTDAAGMNDLVPYLRQSFGQSQVIAIPPEESEEFYSQQLQALNQRSPNVMTLLIVPASLGWRMAWVDRAQQRLATLTSRTAFARVVFIADAQRTWDLLAHEGAALDRALADEVRSITLQPWRDAALHQWFLDCDISPSEREVRAQVTSVTGNWPSLLYQPARLAAQAR
jgi:hypothetical protein